MGTEVTAVAGVGRIPQGHRCAEPHRAETRGADARSTGHRSAPLRPAELRKAFGTFPTGVTAVAALVDGVPAGLAASSFTSVSLDPPLISVCVAHESTTWPLLRDRPRLGISVLGAHQESVGRQLAARDRDRFADLDWRATSEGAVLVGGTGAWFDCSVEQLVRAGDHDIVLLRIHELDTDHSVAPLVFHAGGFHRLAPSPEERPRASGAPE